jgi:hypothetical protein
MKLRAHSKAREDISLIRFPITNREGRGFNRF